MDELECLMFAANARAMKLAAHFLQSFVEEPHSIEAAANNNVALWLLAKARDEMQRIGLVATTPIPGRLGTSE